MVPRSVCERNICLYIHKILYCVIWSKNRRVSLLNGVQEIEENFEYPKNEINEDNLSQRIRYRFPKHEIVDQQGNVFVFDLETYNDEKFAEACAAGLYDVNRL